MQISDEVADIVYRNEENGYSVLRLAAANVTAVGYFPFVSVGQEFFLTGEYVNNAKYGKQFKVEAYEAIAPNSPSRIKQFIGSWLLEGVGPVTAANIVKTFGKDTLAIMEHRPEELTVVKGISLKKARAIGERWGEIKQMQHALAFLQKFDISLNMALRVYNHYKDATVAKVQQNPYRLIETIDGIGFLTADKMAKALGIDYAGRFRVRAGVVYTLKQSAEADGNTFLPMDKLFMGVCRLLKIKAEQLKPICDDVVRELCIDKYLTAVEGGVMLTGFYNAERAIATRLNMLNTDTEQGTVYSDQSLDKLLDHYEELHNIKLHETQREAVITACTSGACVITGGPGTGKTTIVRAILYVNEAQGLKTQLLAPTGRAAKRLEETCGVEARTIHRALDIDYRGGKGVFTYDYEDNAIRADVVIVDEVSMCDVVLTSQLLKKVLRGTRVIFVGDVDQLPSVGAGSVLCDVIESAVLRVVRLTEIYRQTERSRIVVSAHAINRGEMPDLTNKSSDFFFENAVSPADIKAKVVKLVTERLPKYLASQAGASLVPKEKSSALGMAQKIQVLCPMKLGEAGMNSLNLALQEALNPRDSMKPEYEYGQTVFRLGDRVMQTLNNYNQEWVKGGEAGAGVYNGDIGTIIEVNRASGEVTVALEDGRMTTYTRADLANVVLSYAITVHKSQGCEFDVVVIPVTSGAYMILTRNLLYTAVTRARRIVMLVGSAENIRKMVENTYTKRRHTMLKQFLRDMKDKVEGAFKIEG